MSEKKDEKTTTNIKKADKKPSAGERISRWFREMRSELKKVVWPTPKQLINNTIIVIVAVVLVSVVIGVMDGIFVVALNALRQAF